MAGVNQAQGIQANGPRASSGERPSDQTDAAHRAIDASHQAGVVNTRELAQHVGLGGDIVVQGSRANRTARPQSDLDLGIRVSPQKFEAFLNGGSKLQAPNPASSKARTRANAQENGIIQRGEARLSSTGKGLEKQLNMDVDLSVVRRGGNFDRGPDLAVPTPRAATAHAAGRGALMGAVVDGGRTAVNALRDGRISGAEASAIGADTARGATVGATYAVTERGLVKLADRAAGTALQNGLGVGARVVGTRLAGAGAAGAVISAGLSVADNFGGLRSGDAKAYGRVAGDVVVGAGSALAGAAAGAAVGSVVPVVGTAAGAVVGLGIGMAADHVARAGGVDKAVAQAVSGGIDAARRATSAVAGWLGS